MATRKLIAGSATPIRRLILSRVTNPSHANRQDRVLPLFFNLNQRDRLQRPIWELNQVSNADICPVVQDRFALWSAPPIFEAQPRGRQIPKEESEEDEDEDDGKFDEINDFDDDSDCSAEDDDEFSDDWDEEDEK